MAIELIDKIKPKNGGSFAMVDAEDIEMPDGSRLSDHAISGKNEMTGTAVANTMYFLGEISGDVSIAFPETDKEGDMIFVSFSTGSTVPEFTVTTDNHIGLEEFAPQTNAYYEIIGLWNGSKWVFVSHEVI